MAGGSRSRATEDGGRAGARPSHATADGGRAGARPSRAPELTGTDVRERVPPVRNPPLFQRDCWDRQLRSGESYNEKWQYVRNNPVRKGLVAQADDWPYQGVITPLVWHERT